MIACPQCSGLYSSTDSGCPVCHFSPQMVNGFPAWAADLCMAGGGFKAEYFGTLVRLEEGNFWFQSRNKLIEWALKKYFSGLESFLEVGCGTGFVLSSVSRAFPEAHLVGSEIFADGLALAASRLKTADFVQMDARRVPYVDEFDVVAAFDVIEHIEEDETVLENLHRAIKPGGGLLITVPQHSWLWSAADSYACHVRRYSAQDLHEKLGRAGFDIVRSTSFTSLLLPAMLISRRRAGSGEEFNPLAEFEINPVLNRLLKVVLDIERYLTRLGVNFAIGGSRLVVAKKKMPTTVGPV
ncbi:class I SAM-dependent methyltransferase [Cupriavidus sp. YAF13]|uniref:class I SAM-dependent methyltransferase n=1 Tax=Cupriavidus sp. YAF13 TaxID=3233075 RepID=UPI003F93D59B